ncbi:hypothetical protein DFH09DRAFT_1132373 [Mycena vulgaris]|nr:hypothetical protein DFH09DRAFT_1132373 [Mycena vulgaris]
MNTINGKTERPASVWAPRERDAWYYPPEIADDLKGVNLVDEVKAEILTCAWEYTRCVIPHYTNWERYIFARVTVVGIVAEFKGSLVEVMKGDNILGYSLSGILTTLFRGTPKHEDMAREFRSFILISADKSSNRRNGELFRRYVNSLAQSPSCWFRLRDCDGLARFTIAASLACNDVYDLWLSEEQFGILIEIAITMYDAVGLDKHRSEGEVHSTFAYAFRQCREILWALDAAWARQPKMAIVPSFVRIFGGAIHMMMLRYRFVDEDRNIGKPETVHVVTQTRANFKLWNRIDAANDVGEESIQRYRDVLALEDELLFPGLAEILETAGDGLCDTCHHRALYGAETTHRFGGVELCEGCKANWREFLVTFPERAAQAFPELVDVYSRGFTSASGKFAAGGDA